MQSAEVERFCQHLRNRNYSRHSIESYALDLQLFFTGIKKPVSQISWRDVDHFIEQQVRGNYDEAIRYAASQLKLLAA